ncbi:MAG: hypothetical protein WEA28_07235 [Xanthobacteraceae bacterium]
MIAPPAIARNHRRGQKKQLQIRYLDRTLSAPAALLAGPSTDPGQAAGIVKAATALA